MSPVPMIAAADLAAVRLEVVKGLIAAKHPALMAMGFEHILVLASGLGGEHLTPEAVQYIRERYEEALAFFPPAAPGVAASSDSAAKTPSSSNPSPNH